MVFCRLLFLSRAMGTGRRCSTLSSSRSTVLCLSCSAHLPTTHPSHASASCADLLMHTAPIQSLRTNLAFPISFSELFSA